MYKKINIQKKEDVEEAGTPSGISMNAQMSIQVFYLNGKQRRNRRKAVDIERHYKCPVEICGKSYGSEGSLNQHIKIKHPEYYCAYTAKSIIAEGTPNFCPKDNSSS